MEKLENELINCSLKTPIFSLKDKVFLGKCVKCYDGDTVHIVIKFNNEFLRFKSRLDGIDCAEIRSKNDLEKSIALTGKKWLSNLILDKLIWIKCGNFDKYGRLLITIKSYNKELDHNLDFMENINNQLVKLNYGYYYGGGKKRTFNDWYQY